MRAAIQIARVLPSLADATDEQVSCVITGDYGVVQWHVPSRGEQAVCAFALAAERLLESCDAETVDDALQALDRVRAGLVR